jgi:hypothetical protein
LILFKPKTTPAISALEKWEHGLDGFNGFTRIFFFKNDGFKKRIRVNLLYPSNPCSNKIRKRKLLKQPILIRQTFDNQQISFKKLNLFLQKNLYEVMNLHMIIY